MADRLTLLETLRSRSSALRAIRKVIADGGHLEAMNEIDGLLSVAISEADRVAARLPSQR